MRSCPRCGQALTLDDIRCPSCRTTLRPSDARTSSKPCPDPSQSSTPTKLSQLTDPELTQPNSPTPLGERRTKTLVGHGNVAFPAENTADRGWTPPPSNRSSNARIEPLPVVTVLGVPIPRSPSSRPGSISNPPTSGRLNHVSDAPRDATQTIQGHRNVFREPDYDSNESTRSKRLISKDEPSNGSVEALNSAASLRTTITNPPAFSSPTENSNPSVDGSEHIDHPSPRLLNASNQPSTPPRDSTGSHRVYDPVTEVDSLFYYIDSQVLGLPPPSRGSSSISAAPPDSQRPIAPEDSHTKTRQRRRAVLVTVILLMAIAILVLVRMPNKNNAVKSQQSSPTVSSKR
jgi:hypothetical protein